MLNAHFAKRLIFRNSLRISNNYILNTTATFQVINTTSQARFQDFANTQLILKQQKLFTIFGQRTTIPNQFSINPRTSESHAKIPTRYITSPGSWKTKSLAKKSAATFMRIEISLRGTRQRHEISL